MFKERNDIRTLQTPFVTGLSYDAIIQQIIRLAQAEALPLDFRHVQLTLLFTFHTMNIGGESLQCAMAKNPVIATTSSLTRLITSTANPSHGLLPETHDEAKAKADADAALDVAVLLWFAILGYGRQSKVYDVTKQVISVDLICDFEHWSLRQPSNIICMRCAR